MKRIISAILTIILLLTLCPAALAAHVQRSPQKLEVNGELIDCDKYNIDGSNYFKLRDLACLLSGTGSQFNVGYDANAQAVIVTTGESYVSVDGDLVIGADRSRSAVISAQTIYIDGEKVTNLSAYNIGGNNFFKLRDLGAALGFNVDYDAASDTAIVESVGTAESRVEQFQSLLSEISAQQYAITNQKLPYDDFKQYLVDDPSSKALITQEEIEQITQSRSQKQTVTYAQAVADIDLYFKTLKYGYGAYYYYGGDAAFESAKAAVMNSIAGKSIVSVGQLGTSLSDALKFVHDGHFAFLGNSAIEAPDVRYKYYYSAPVFYAEGSRYFCMQSGEKLYYIGCSNPNISMERILTDGGKIAYGLVQFCPRTVAHTSDQINVQTESGSPKNLTVTWTQSEPFAKMAFHSSTDFQCLKENGIAYISYRSCDQKLAAEQAAYAQSGTTVKDAQLIIFDIRCNGGGGDEFSREWIYNFSGARPSVTALWSDRRTALGLFPNTYAPLGEERYIHSEIAGKIISNKTPIIILTDDLCGSSGELTLLFLKTLENTIVVGSNTSGYQLCGNVRSYSLPNTGLAFRFGASLNFIKELKNIDGIGYEPDIWCNPKTSLDAVLAMLQRYDLSDAATVNAIKDQLK